MDDSTKPYSVGIYRKIHEIKETLEKNFDRVDILFRENNFFLLNYEPIARLSKLKLFKNLSIYFILRKIAILASKYQVVYIRDFSESFFLISKLKASNIIKVVDIPTCSDAQIQEVLRSNTSILNKLRYLFKKLILSRIAYKHSDILLITGGSVGYIERKNSHKIIVTTNGIDVKKYIQMSHSPENYSVINLVAVANISFWHGLDRVIRGLALYYKNANLHDPKIIFNVVGNGEHLETLKQLSKELNVDSHINWHDVLKGENLENLLLQCNIAIGSLGVHRIKVNIASPLKHREYCALGIPFVFAHEDPGFPVGFPFALRVPATDDPLDIKEIVNWYFNIQKNYPDYPNLMRKYAEANLTWDAKLKSLIEKIIKLAKKRGLLS